MLLDHLVEQGLSHLLATLQKQQGDPEPFAPVGRRTAGVGWTDITGSFPPSDYDYGPEWDGQLYGFTIPTGSVPNPANITTWQAIEMTISHPFATFFGTQTEPFPVGFRYASSGWAWDSTTPGVQFGYGPEPSPLPVDDEVDRQSAIERALRRLPGPRDSTHPDTKPWPTSPEKGDSVPEPLVAPPEPLRVPKAVVEVIRDLVRPPSPTGPPAVINGDPTIYVPPGRRPQPVVKVLPKPMRERGKTVRQTNLPKGKKLRARSHQALWALRVMAEWAVEQCDDVKATWNSLSPTVRKVIRQRWFERRWAEGDRRPPKVPPCNEMAELLWEYRRFINAEPVFRELLWARIEDWAYGKTGQIASERLGHIQGRSGPHTTVGESETNHWASPELPLAQLQEIVTGRGGRTTEEDDKQFAIDEQIRRSANRRAEMARRKAYRRGI